MFDRQGGASTVDGPDSESQTFTHPDQSYPNHASADRMTASASRRVSRRKWADELVLRAAELDPNDRALVEAALVMGIPYRRIASLHRCAPATVGRRLRRLRRRLVDPLFVFVHVNQAQIPDPLKRIARLVILEGRTTKSVASALGISFSAVRAARNAVVMLAKAHQPDLASS